MYHSIRMQYRRDRLILFISVLVFFVLTTGAGGTYSVQAQTNATEETYSKSEIAQAMEGFFAEASEVVASAVERTFNRYGRPNGYIQGEEGSAAFFVGLRYGYGTLHLKSGLTRIVYWQGPSVGWDVGGNASKVFTLVYNLHDIERLYQRFPGVEGSVYVIGGLSVNAQRSQDITLVPIRSGVGLRLGANVGYLQYTKEKGINPF